jgi:hypothetical protein
MTEYLGQQFVGIDLHRRRSVVVRTKGSGSTCSVPEWSRTGWLGPWRSLAVISDLLASDWVK